ncbi:hypothetical protein Nepgr_004389 [Nepenthes gracilis]|uniref:Uncharacterized protein n=1 Tax=Nepenthes gracilis TaxID=150966 RepID=A0AAD3XF62_NEPGR|nr:hypothetical protein Nepgr_004389 [Nepenthes gracilis]
MFMSTFQHVFEYFTEQTPRSHCELRETSLVWNYKYADFEFGRLQARDMLQHLWTGPISNASVDVVQGSRSVEVRAIGVTKGFAIDRILGEIVHSKPLTSPIDCVLCIGHFPEKPRKRVEGGQSGKWPVKALTGHEAKEARRQKARKSLGRCRSTALTGQSEKVLVNFVDRPRRKKRARGCEGARTANGYMDGQGTRKLDGRPRRTTDSQGVRTANGRTTDGACMAQGGQGDKLLKVCAVLDG